MRRLIAAVACVALLAGCAGVERARRDAPPAREPERVRAPPTPQPALAETGRRPVVVAFTADHRILPPSEGSRQGGAAVGASANVACAAAKRSLFDTLLAVCSRNGGAGVLVDTTAATGCTCIEVERGRWQCATFAEVTCTDAPAETVATGAGAGSSSAIAAADAVEDARSVCALHDLAAHDAPATCTCSGGDCVCLVTARCGP